MECLSARELFENQVIQYEDYAAKTQKMNISSCASWCIWAEPTEFNTHHPNEKYQTKENVADSMFEGEKAEESKQMLSDGFIFVGLNPSLKGKDKSKNPCSNCARKNKCDEEKMIKTNKGFPPWHNFHSGCTKRSQDYKLRRVFYQEDFGNKFKGSLIIDLLPDKENQDSKQVLQETTQEEIINGLKVLFAIWEQLGKPVIVPMGMAAFDQFDKYRYLLPEDLVVRGIRHFSASGYETFKRAVKQLSEDDYKSTELIMYTGKNC